MDINQIIQIITFLVLLMMPLICCVFVGKRFQGFSGLAISVVAAALIMSSLVLIQWLSYDWYLEQQITPLDRNGDGFWTNDERATWTDQDRKNMEVYFGDGGRNVFALMIFSVFSIVYSLLIGAGYWLIVAIRSRHSKNG